MKNIYEIAEMEISVFESEDVITTSLPAVGEDNGDWGNVN